jgi:hypothetical protein
VPHLHNFRRCHGHRVQETIHSELLRFHAQGNAPDSVLPLLDKAAAQDKPFDQDNDHRWQDLALVQCDLDLLHAHNKVDLVHDLADLVVADLVLAHKVDRVDPLLIELKVHDLVVLVQAVDSPDDRAVPVQVVHDPVDLVDEEPLLVHSERERRSRRSRSRRRLSAKRLTICKHPYWVACVSLAVMVRRSDFDAERHFRILRRR